jgi:hypothetical protein
MSVMTSVQDFVTTGPFWLGFTGPTGADFHDWTIQEATLFGHNLLYPT